MQFEHCVGKLQPAAVSYRLFKQVGTPSGLLLLSVSVAGLLAAEDDQAQGEPRLGAACDAGHAAAT